MVYILVFLIWYAVGFAGFVFWWTKDFDFTSEQVGTAMLCGIMGPYAWYVGYSLHGDKKPPSVLIGKRGGK